MGPATISLRQIARWKCIRTGFGRGVSQGKQDRSNAKVLICTGKEACATISSVFGGWERTADTAEPDADGLQRDVSVYGGAYKERRAVDRLAIRPELCRAIFRPAEMLRCSSPTPPPRYFNPELRSGFSGAPPTPASAVCPDFGDSVALLCHSKRQILGKNRPLRPSKIRSTFAGFRIAFAAVVLALCTSIASADQANAPQMDKSTDKCADFKTAGYKIGFYLDGETFSPMFNGTEIDLMKEYNYRADNKKKPGFEPTTARLLHGYDTSYALLYEAGHTADIGKKVFIFNPYSNNKVEVHEWTRSEEGVFNFPDVTIRFSIGNVNPAEITFFDDVVFAGGKKINITRSLSEHEAVEAEDMDPQISYKEKNHFDPAHWVSFEPSNSTKTLIGVVDGKKVLREECVPGLHNHFFINVKCDEVCFRMTITGDLKSYCFFIEDCPIATGPMGLFHTVLVFPKDPIERPKIPPPTLALTTTEASTYTVNTTANSSATEEAGFDYEAADRRQREINAAAINRKLKVMLSVAFFIIVLFLCACGYPCSCWLLKVHLKDAERERRLDGFYEFCEENTDWQKSPEGVEQIRNWHMKREKWHNKLKREGKWLVDGVIPIPRDEDGEPYHPGVSNRVIKWKREINLLLKAREEAAAAIEQERLAKEKAEAELSDSPNIIDCDEHTEETQGYEDDTQQSQSKHLTEKVKAAVKN
ncbi:hypothetical protein L596_030170 [Steinernema carpocapsae]|uniref:Uncharacterized protein n=1 Tax=Steinernema carpocapsae TaxID=34508 RepID=A0A4U5LRY2_STECR|nr:hypothetical protein L596_030170 [Steinernema carpocapsae]